LRWGNIVIENCREFLEKCDSNAIPIIEAYKKFGYDVYEYYKNMAREEKSKADEAAQALKNNSDKISKIYIDFYNLADKGSFDNTLQNMMAEQGAKYSTDKLLEYYKSIMAKMKK